MTRNVARDGTLTDFTDVSPAPTPAPRGKKATEGPQVLSVAELNRKVRNRLEADPTLRGLHVSGEISNYFRAGSGHVYFTLKDDGAEVRCIMWRDAAARLGFEPKNGLAVLAYSDVTVYEQKGQYQLRVIRLEPEGEGLLWLQLAELKKRLEQEGLFDEAKKRPLPKLPQRVGVVTSKDGAALHDILQVLSRRAPYLEVTVVDARVQGREATMSLIRGLERIQREDVDVIIIGRGGGSLEDLWAFNEELVVRAVAACKIPIVCAVGHETDWSLSDLAADWRAPTPSAAAEHIAPSIWEIHQNLDHCEARLAKRLSGRLEVARHRLEAITTRAVFKRPSGLTEPQAKHVGQLLERLHRCTRSNLTHARNRYQALAARPVLVRGELIVTTRKQQVEALAARLPRTAKQAILKADEQTKRCAGLLDALSPLKVISRGYSVATKKGHVVRSVDQVEPGDPLEVKVPDGTIETKITAKRRNPE
jgi:exodeoxyribonuclease VII large subunit